MEKPKKPHSEEQRFIHDMEQASAMRRRKLQVQPKPGRTSTSSTKEILSLGIKGLDEADKLREDGHIQCALNLYQSAIEVLIRLLRSKSSFPAPYDKVALEERMRVALTDAENCKEKLRRGGCQQSTCETSSESPMRKTCFSRITEYLASVQTSTAGNKVEHSQALPRKQTQLTRKSQGPTAQSSSNRSMSSVKSNQIVGSNPSRYRQPTSMPMAPSKEAHGLMQSVVEDMFVPPNQLQSTSWNDIAGLATAKQALQEAAILPRKKNRLLTAIFVVCYNPTPPPNTMCFCSGSTRSFHGSAKATEYSIVRASRNRQVCLPPLLHADLGIFL